MAPRCCPVPGCANPYLAWHDLGPDERVALCLAHAGQAEDVPADRLRALARSTEGPADPARPGPAWRQRKVLVRLGGNFFYETPVILRLRSLTCIGFSRDEEHNLLLTLRMPTTSGQPRAVLTDNFWEVPPIGAEVVCPRSGRVLDIAYPNGDLFRLELGDLHSAHALQVRFGSAARWAYRVQFPVTLASISLSVANTDLEVGPDVTGMGGPTTVDCFTSRGDAALEIPMTPEQLYSLFP